MEISECEHEYVFDLIDIDPDRSKIVLYCVKCELIYDEKTKLILDKKNKPNKNKINTNTNTNTNTK